MTTALLAPTALSTDAPFASRTARQLTREPRR
ncbi:MAG: hypothetical protein JWP68_2094, partial [Modestobacter sp.]|nr:hypothetical protein [Modestobacter sp.]